MNRQAGRTGKPDSPAARAAASHRIPGNRTAAAFRQDRFLIAASRWF
jgi:hypothetical protein